MFRSRSNHTDGSRVGSFAVLPSDSHLLYSKRDVIFLELEMDWLGSHERGMYGRCACLFDGGERAWRYIP